MKLTSGALRLAVATALCVTTTLACGDRSKPGSAGETPFPQTAPFSTEEAARFHAIRDSVSALRGLPVKSDVKEGVVSQEELRAYVETALKAFDANERRRMVAGAAVLRLLHLIGPDDDLEQLMVSVSSDAVAGMYVVEEKRLVIVSNQPKGGYSEESTIAHEYVHSLQDSAFGLLRFRELGKDDRTSELSNTIPCVYEGDATLASFLYMNDKYQESWLAAVRDETTEAQAKINLPEAIGRYFYFNYNECLLFSLSIWQKQKWQGIDALYRKPPTTTEQIMHPQKYLDAEAAKVVTTTELTKALGSGWRKTDGWAFGEFDVYNYLVTAGSAELLAKRAAAGWGGGQLVQYSRSRKGLPAETTAQIRLEWDTPQDFDEFRSQFERALIGLRYGTRDTADALMWQWSSEDEYGYALWNAPSLRVDLLLGTDQPSLRRAKDFLLAERK